MSLLLRNLLLSLTLLVAAPAVTYADRHGRHSDQGDDDRGRDRDRDRGGEKRGREMSLDQAVQMVQKRYNAQVVRAETIREGGRTIYRLRLLNKDGRVWTVTVDASSGR